MKTAPPRKGLLNKQILHEKTAEKRCILPYLYDRTYGDDRNTESFLPAPVLEEWLGWNPAVFWSIPLEERGVSARLSLPLREGPQILRWMSAMSFSNIAKQNMYI